MECNSVTTQQAATDSWNGLSRDVIERFVDVAGFTRSANCTQRRAYRADLCALETWMHGQTGHTIMTANTAELWTYFRKLLGAGADPHLIERLLTSMRHFYSYAREGGYRTDDPAISLPQWFHNYSVTSRDSLRNVPEHVHG